MTEHPDWPPQGQHMFSQWRSLGKQMREQPNGKMASVDIQWRRCIHPKCRAVEEREAPKG
jgi:hypothetical protein